MSAPQRDAYGRFSPGHANISPGRPKRQTEETYLETLRETVTPDEWRAICARAVADAKAGDNKARSFVAAYLLGTPTQRVETVDSSSVDELIRRFADVDISLSTE